MFQTAAVQQIYDALVEDEIQEAERLAGLLDGALVDEPDQKNHSLLSHAIAMQCQTVAGILIQKGANVRVPIVNSLPKQEVWFTFLDNEALMSIFIENQVPENKRQAFIDRLQEVKDLRNINKQNASALEASSFRKIMISSLGGGLGFLILANSDGILENASSIKHTISTVALGLLALGLGICCMTTFAPHYLLNKDSQEYGRYLFSVLDEPDIDIEPTLAEDSSRLALEV